MALPLALFGCGLPISPALAANTPHTAATAGPSIRIQPLALATPPATGPRLQRLPAHATGLTFTNQLSIDRFTTNQIYLNGSGVTAGDVDDDGAVDVFFAGLSGGSRLYRNLGAWKFQDVTGESGLGAATATLDATGCALADIDGDGDLDLVLNSVGGGTRWFRNTGTGRFAEAASLNPGRGGMSLALADWDLDGDLDLYVTNYRTDTLRDKPRTNFRIEKVNGQPVVALVNGQPTSLPELEGRFTYEASGGITEHGEPDALYRNDGGRFSPLGFTDGTFLDTTGQPLKQPLYDWGLSVLARDLTGDGLPDLYVCNDFASEDRFWINQGRGRFQAASMTALRCTSQFSMGVDAADMDRDGHDDFFVLDMLSRTHATRMTRMDGSLPPPGPGIGLFRPQYPRSTLQRARGDGTFEEIAQFAGVHATEWSWTPLFLDVDLDGFEDLLITTGHGRDDAHLDFGMRIEAQRRAQRLSVLDELRLRRGTPALATPNLLFRNLGGMRFEEVGAAWGFGDEAGVSHGMCVADLDGDGDLDVLVNRLNAVAAVFRNDSSAPRIAVRLAGARGNTRGLGARITLDAAGLPRQSQEMIAGGRYLSSDDAMRVFAAGNATRGHRLMVRWPNRRTTILEDVPPNSLVTVSESETSKLIPDPPLRVPPLWFDDVTSQLGHTHFETPFQDFERQPLLPHRLSQSGPGVAWIDLNHDGFDDLAIGNGRGGRLTLFLGAASGRFQRIESSPAPRDQTGLAGWGGPHPGLLVTATAWEDSDTTGAGLDRFHIDGSSSTELAIPGGSGGPLALGDADGDGDLDLFVGGRPQPGRSPLVAPSRFWERRDGTWVERRDVDQLLASLGSVQGAVWSDLNLDGLPELVVASEWAPIRVFAPAPAGWTERTSELGLTRWKGLWSGIAVLDADGDGHLDFVAGNRGLNTRLQASEAHPYRLHYGDLAQVGQIELVESAFDTLLGQWMPARDLNVLSKSLPWLRAQFPSHQSFAQANTATILGDRSAAATTLDATTLATTLFLNRTSHFEAVLLPAPAQWSPVWGVSSADFDLDGRDDLFLAQNFFAEPAGTSRSDAGRGLLLRGLGNATFERIDMPGSGLEIWGEQRGTAVSDFDRDGRPDLVVAQNSGPTRLFRNVSRARGLRVRLLGPPGNPDGAGAILRVRDQAGGLGPARETHAGSGYGSQDSAVSVLAVPSNGGSLHVLWPGGRRSEHALTAGIATLDIAFPGPTPGSPSPP